MEISSRQSDALRIATLLATMMVVLRHSFNLHLYYTNGNPWMAVSDGNIFLQRLVSSFTDVAIPAFFLISGFLFCNGMTTWQECLPKWRKRIKSLLLPYLLWNLLWYGLFGGLYFTQALHSQIITSFNWEWSWSFFLSRMTYAPIVGQFWYIRTLIIFVLCAPLLLPILKSSGLSLIVFIALVRLWSPIDTRLLSTEGLLFFFIGCWLGINGCLPKAEPPRRWLWLALILTVRLVSPLLGRQVIPLAIGTTMELYIGWQCCLRLARKARVCALLKNLNQHSFFIYALHGSIVRSSALVLSRRIPHTAVHSFVAFISCFLFTIVFSIGISKFVKHFMPRFYSVLSGGR